MTNVAATRLQRTFWAGRDFDSKILKVVVLGDYGVGKTCMIKRFVKNEFNSPHLPTVGVEFMTRVVTVGKVNYSMMIWDTSGQERFKCIQTVFYRGADCLLLIFSLDDRRSFQNVTKWLEEFFKYGVFARSCSFPIVVVGNKADLENRAVTSEEAQHWCSLNGNLPYFETSAKDTTNVNEAFLALLRQFCVREAKDTRTVVLIDRGAVQLGQPARGNKRCC